VLELVTEGLILRTLHDNVVVLCATLSLSFEIIGRLLLTMLEHAMTGIVSSKDEQGPIQLTVPTLPLAGVEEVREGSISFLVLWMIGTSYCGVHGA
jgi:hypothetical protein